MAFCQMVQWLAIPWPLKQSKHARIFLRYSKPLERRKQTIYVVKGQDIREGFTAAQKVWGNFPTAISFIFVESLGVPSALPVLPIVTLAPPTPKVIILPRLASISQLG
jgi:hypothetical protein